VQGSLTLDVRELRRAARALVVATAVIYFVETVAGLLLGLAAGSPALVGLGLDSAVKLLAALVVFWELAGRPDPRHERAALRLLAFAFFVVAAFLTVQGVRGLLEGSDPDVAPAELVAAGLGALLLPPLVVAKRALAEQLGSATLVSDADKSRLYAVLCAAVLAGLALELALGWWWADPLAALAVALLAFREGQQDWREADALALTVENPPAS
jgi:divalent metal cation (Fe/Co/Zn/Cd) transporter